MIELTATVPEDAFDASVLSRLFPAEIEGDFSQGATGPLRIGGRGKDDFRITASIDLHKTPEPHYHVWVHGVASKAGVDAKTEWPTVATFFETVAAGLKNPEGVELNVLVEHRYPRGWWRGGMSLPVPLPGIQGETHAGAELTGLEVSYSNEDGTERVLITSRNETFRVFISFLSGVQRDLFTIALRRSAMIGERLFNQGTRQTEDA